MGAGRERGRVRIALMTLVVITGAALLGVWGYTSAQVNSNAEVAVVKSEDALIAVAVEDGITLEQGSSGVCGRITNNMAASVELTICGDACVFDYDSVLLPGGSTDLTLQVPDGAGPGLTSYPGMVIAEWDGGNAEIEFEALVDVFVPESSEDADDCARNRYGETAGPSYDGLEGVSPGTGGTGEGGNGDAATNGNGGSGDTGNNGGGDNGTDGAVGSIDGDDSDSDGDGGDDSNRDTVGDAVAGQGGASESGSGDVDNG